MPSGQGAVQYRKFRVIGMTTTRRDFLTAAVTAAGAAVTPGLARAQERLHLLFQLRDGRQEARRRRWREPQQAPPRGGAFTVLKPGAGQRRLSNDKKNELERELEIEHEVEHEHELDIEHEVEHEHEHVH